MIRSRGARATKLRGALSLGILSCVCLAGLASAGGTKSVRQTTAKDFEEGEATASIILPTGDVMPGMKTSHIAADAAFVWCAALTRDGRTAYFGTGDQGRLYAVPVSASGDGASPTARRLAEIDSAWITSLALKPDGTILAGSTPGGRLFAINPGSGVAKAIARVTADHVWALAHEAKSGITYVATGGPGKLFAIDAKGGPPRLIWDAGDKHVVSLMARGDGTLLAGTSEEAILYRVHPSGRAEALHDFEADEVRAIARVGKATYLAVNDFDKPSDIISSGPAAARGTRITSGAGSAPVSAGSLPRPGQVKAKAGIYRLQDDGQVEQVFSLPDGYFTALLAEPSGEVYAAAGTQGKIYRVSPDGSVALAADLPERQALSLIRTGEGFLVGTGDVGGIYRVRPAAAGEASYLSKIFDATVPARWGHVRWTGSQNLVFETRSGNTAKPDNSWTDWRKLDGISYGGSEGQGRVATALSRYLQYRVSLPAKGAVLREAQVYYLPQNQRARVTEVTIAEGATGTAAAAARTHSPLLKLRWKTENPDDDELIYRLFFRQEGETVWRPLGGPDPLIKAEYDWNTDAVPDGRYVVRVWVSDEKVTPSDRALDFTFQSPPLLVDNSKPRVLELASRSASTITGLVRDDASPITQIEYSIDGQEWRPVGTKDGLLDERTESFSFKLPKLPSGPHVVTVRAYDDADNIGTANITVQIGK